MDQRRVFYRAPIALLFLAMLVSASGLGAATMSH